MSVEDTGMLATVDGSGSMFDRIAKRYDLLNRLMSFGMDRGWRKKMITAVQCFDGARYLDVATGTADVAIAVAKQGNNIQVWGIDPSPGMLNVGQRKIQKEGLESRVFLTCANALGLPYNDDHFDGACISFGIRNVQDRLLGLQEMTRVTRPGGRIVILELGEPRTGFMAPFARFHIHQVVPRLGAWLSGEKEYRYLHESIAEFPPAGEFAALMEQAGLSQVEVQPLSFGAAHIYVGVA
jgi:demethylmenaquinone methyltransferase/2-methoxy-6-polyprenyl-1,4-benzoquinol methylase